MLTVLVCGGRDFTNSTLLYETLDHLHRLSGIARIVEGGQRTLERGKIVGGADYFATCWALSRRVPSTIMQAEWTKYGPAAGPIRNQRMLDETHPDLVVAFPGGRGTADMVAKAKAAGVEVREVAALALAIDW